MLKYFKVTLIEESCGDYGCDSSFVYKVVAAKNSDRALDMVYDEDDLSTLLGGVEELTIPDLNKKDEEFVLV